MNKNIILTTKQLIIALGVIIAVVFIAAYMAANWAFNRNSSVLSRVEKKANLTNLALGRIIQQQTVDVEHEVVNKRNPIGFKVGGQKA